MVSLGQHGFTMPTPKTRSHRRFRLDVSSAKTVPILEDPPPIPWPVACLGGGLVAALTGLVLVVGLVVVGWLGATSVPVGAMLSFAVQVWLAAHGGGLASDGVWISVVPLGLSVLVAAGVGVTAAIAYRQAQQARPQPIRPGQRHQLVALTAVQVCAGYLVVVLSAALAIGAEPLRFLPGGLVLSLGAGVVGAGWQAGYGKTVLPWLRVVIRGAAAGLLGLVIVAAVVLATALVQGETRIAALEQSLGFDGFGVVVWVVTSLLYLPDLLAWTASWILAAGFTLGDGSLVAPWVTRLGLLPSIPMLGALPTDGSNQMAGWIAAGVLPGLLAGVIAVRSRASAVVPAVVAGAASGLLAGLAYAGWAMASVGALGTDRFAHVGPRVPEVLIGVGILTLSAAIGALGAWFADSRAGSAD
jgi:hypothetical protein